MSVTEAPLGANVGSALRRKEDPPLITGHGRYVDDITLPGQLWASFVPSPEANAIITSIDTSAAVARDGITAVFTGEDMSDLGGRCRWRGSARGRGQQTEHWPLAKGAVKHVGDPVAVVIGEDRYAVQGRHRGRARRVRDAARHRRPEAAIAGAPFVPRVTGHEPGPPVDGWPGATSNRGSPRRTSSSSAGSSTTGSPGADRVFAVSSPTTVPGR